MSVCPSTSLALSSHDLSLKQIHRILYTISLFYLIRPDVLSVVGNFFRDTDGIHRIVYVFQYLFTCI
jgi:hypothetical protein